MGDRVKGGRRGGREREINGGEEMERGKGVKGDLSETERERERERQG